MVLEDYEQLYNSALQLKSTYETLEAQLEQTKKQKQCSKSFEKCKLMKLL